MVWSWVILDGLTFAGSGSSISCDITLSGKSECVIHLYLLVAGRVMLSMLCAVADYGSLH